MEWIIALITQVRAVRAEMNVPAGARIPLVLSSASETATQRVTTHSGLIERLARVSALTIDPGPAPKGSVQIVLDGATAALPIADVIDIGQERARLNKELEKHQGELLRSPPGLISRLCSVIDHPHRQPAHQSGT